MQPQTEPQAESTADADPVCGMTVAPTIPHRTTFNGAEYRFCSARCREKFIAEPTRW